MISFTLPLEPVAWQRVKRGAYGQAYVPAKTRKFKAEVAMLAKTRLTAPFDGPLRLTVNFYLTPPRRKVRELPHVRPDLDNYIKAIKDGLNGIAWLDDAQIVDLSALKLYAWDTREGRIEIQIQEIGEK